MSTITSIHEHAVEVDTRLAETHKHLSDINYKIQREESSIRRIVGQIWDWSNQVWNGTFAEAVAVTEFTSEWKAKGHAESIVNHDALIVVRDSLHIIIDECDADWRANGRWSRFYLVTNSNGHIHSSVSCSTCFHDTNFAWLTHLSGLDEASAVQAEGEVLCTICYPSAPVSWTNGISRRDKEAKAKREAEKAERQRIKAEKSLSINGDVVEIRTEGKSYRSHKEFKTLRSAELWLVEAYAHSLSLLDTHCEWKLSAPDAYSDDNVEYVLGLFIEKTGRDGDEVIAHLLKKAGKKVRDTY